MVLDVLRDDSGKNLLMELTLNFYGAQVGVEERSHGASTTRAASATSFMGYALKRVRCADDNNSRLTWISC